MEKCKRKRVFAVWYQHLLPAQPLRTNVFRFYLQRQQGSVQTHESPPLLLRPAVTVSDSDKYTGGDGADWAAAVRADSSLLGKDGACIYSCR